MSLRLYTITIKNQVQLKIFAGSIRDSAFIGELTTSPDGLKAFRSEIGDHEYTELLTTVTKTPGIPL